MDLVYAATNGGMGTKSKCLPKQNEGQACRWGFKPFICERRLREYKSTLINKGLNYFISVKLLILETIVSQRPWLYRWPPGDHYVTSYVEVAVCMVSGGSSSHGQAVLAESIRWKAIILLIKTWLLLWKEIG